MKTWCIHGDTQGAVALFCSFPGHPLARRGHLLPGEGAGEGGGAAGSRADNQRGVSEGHPEGGRAVVGRLPPGPPPLLLLPRRPREVLPERETPRREIAG